MSLATAPLDVTVEMGAEVRAPARVVKSDLPCRTFDPDLWFSDAPAELELAKSLCVDCPVRVECLEYALKYRIDHGVWGGCSERERRRILRQRRITASR